MKKQPYSLPRVAKMHAYTQHSLFCSQLSDEPVGYLARAQVADIPSPYRYSASVAIWDWQGNDVIWFETRHKTYEVFKVPPTMKRFKTDNEATDWHIKNS